MIILDCVAKVYVLLESSCKAVFYAESRHVVLRTGDCALGRALVS